MGKKRKEAVLSLLWINGFEDFFDRIDGLHSMPWFLMTVNR